MSNIKTKCEIIKTHIKEQKENKKKTGASSSFSSYFPQMDVILGCGDVIDFPEKTEVGASSICDDKIDASSDSDSNVNTFNVLKQVLKKLLAKGDDSNLKFNFDFDF